MTPNASDPRLLQLYRRMRTPEAQCWNLSSSNLYIEWQIRSYFEKHAKLRHGARVCNVGIGAGEWDDFLGYALEGKGTLTSVDLDSRICSDFAFRQKRERHPNRSTVICDDLLAPTSLPRSTFDLVTVVGSTLKETGKPLKALRNALALANSRGRLLVMGFGKLPLERLPARVEHLHHDRTLRGLGFVCAVLTPHA